MIVDRSIVFIIFVGAVLQGCTADYQSSRKTGRQSAPPPEITIIESGQLEAIPGFRGAVLGAEVIDAEVSGDQQIIQINLPIDPDRVDQVRVVSPSGEKLKQSREAEILRDYENDNVGLKIFLPRQKTLGFRLKLIDDSNAD
jgi:hypothetical protein